MPSPYGKTLTGIGLMNPDDSTLTKKARDKFIEEVGALLTTGNAGGHGQLNALGKLIPLPPIPGPDIPNVTTLAVEKLFWFDADPFASLMVDTIKDPLKVPIYHQIFIDLLFEKTAAAMNVAGGTPLAPIFDVTCAFPDLDLPLPFTPPQLQLKLKLPDLPSLTLKLLNIGIKIPPEIPKLPLPPIPPNVPIPHFALPFPPFALFDLIIGLIKIPFSLVLKLAIPSPQLIIDLPNLPKLVFKLAFDIVVQLLIDLNLLLITPKLLIATILVYLKNVVGMVIVDVMGLVFGAGGVVTKGAAQLCGLV